MNNYKKTLVTTLVILMLTAMVVPLIKAAEVVSIEVVDDTQNEVINVVQGQTTDFTIELSATGQLDNSLPESSPGSVTIQTVFSIDSAGLVSTSSPSSSYDFWWTPTYNPGNGKATPGQVTWDGAATPYSVAVQVSAAVDTPVGDYTVTIVPTIDNSGVTGLRLVNGEVDEMTIHVSAPLQSDTTAPTTTLYIDSGTVGNNGWYTSSVTISLSASDDDDAAADITTYYTIDDGTTKTDTTPYSAPFTISDDGGYTVEYWSVDKAGNEELPHNTASINIDQTAPEITINTPIGGALYLVNEPVTADWTATDATSGIDSSSGTIASGDAIDTSENAIGSHSFTVIATDKAGNKATKTVTYSLIYNFDGFLAPIGNDGKGLFKLGSTVPVKFQLTDYYGVSISTATAHIFIAYVTPENLVQDEQAASSTSAATTGNLFRYDSTNQQYIFNWGTKGLAPGTYQIRAELGDGTTDNIALVSLKK